MKATIKSAQAAPEPAIGEMAPALTQRSAPMRSVRWGYVFLLAVPLIALNCGWIANSEIRNNLTEGTVSTLFMGVLFILFLLTLVNLLVRRTLGARAALNQAELMALYVMLSMSSGIAGVSYLGFLPLCLPSPYWFGETGGDAPNLQKMLPAHFGPQDPAILKGFYGGNATFFEPRILAAWAYPLAMWSLFLLTLLWTMLCLSVILRRRWAEEEHLPFPVLAVPMEITREGAPIYRSHLLWAGFAIPCFLHSLNTLHDLYPSLPAFTINSAHDMSSYLQRPWNGVDALLMLWHPVGIGFGYLINTEVSFSLFFFYLLKKLLGVLGVALGWRDPRPGDWNGDMAPQFPFTVWQGWGAWMALALSVLWTGRHSFRRYLKRAMRGDPGGIDRQEPMSARVAVGGFVVGFLALCAFVWWSGASLWLPVVFFGFYLLLMVAIARMRAETAVLSTALDGIEPQVILPALVGSRNLAPTDMAQVGMLSWFNRDYRGAVMPHQLEGLIGLQRSGARLPPLVGAMMLTALLSIIAALLWDMQMYYVNGAATANVVSWRNEYALNSWQSMEKWLHNPESPNITSIAAMAVGSSVTFALGSLRNRFVGFPLHPAAYVLNTAVANDFFWCDMGVAWVVKGLILRYGGMALYRRLLPFFLGLILGDFVMGAAWCLVGMAMHVSLFRTFPV